MNTYENMRKNQNRVKSGLKPPVLVLKKPKNARKWFFQNQTELLKTPGLCRPFLYCIGSVLGLYGRIKILEKWSWRSRT